MASRPLLLWPRKSTKSYCVKYVSTLFWVRDADLWTFGGINVTWDDSNSADQHMVKLTDGSGWTWTNSELWGAKSYAALLVVSSGGSEPVDWTISYNCIHDTAVSHGAGSNQDHLIYANSGTHDNRGLITRNLLFGAPNGNAVKLGGATFGNFDTSGVTVSYNTMVGGVYDAKVTWTSASNTFDHDILAGTLGSAELRGLTLTSATNVVSSSVWWGGSFQFSDGQPFQSLSNVNLDPMFDEVSCEGLHPQAVGAQAYGRWAP